jgi:hypothetical protein
MSSSAPTSHRSPNLVQPMPIMATLSLMPVAMVDPPLFYAGRQILPVPGIVKHYLIGFLA